MIPQEARDLIARPKEARDVFEPDLPFFWVDWREDDAEIIKYCTEIVGADRVRAEEDESDLFVTGNGKRLRVPLTESSDDRHITLLSVNQVLAPDHEIRYVWASHGSDTACLLLLASSEWDMLEAEYGSKRVDVAFLRLRGRPNIFTDSMFPPGKRWWQFWR